MIAGQDWCLARKMYWYCAASDTANRAPSSRPSRTVAVLMRPSPGRGWRPASFRMLVTARSALVLGDLE